MTEPSPPTLERAYRVRLRQTPAQALMRRRIFGARRPVWNWALAEQAARARGRKRSGLTSLSVAFTTRRSTGETAWLSQLPREPFNQTLRDLEAAWARFFKGQNRRPTRKRFGTVNAARFTLDQRRDGLDTVVGKTGRVQHDRDANVATNIKREALRRLVEGSGVSPATPRSGDVKRAERARALPAGHRRQDSRLRGNAN